MNEGNKSLKAERIEAFNVVVAQYESGILNYTSRIINDYNAAQDVVQDTFLKFFRKWTDEIKPCPQVSSWLYRVAHNRAVDYLRKESRLRLLHKKQAEEKCDYILPDRGKAFRISAEAEKAVVALSKLSIREQQLVVLKIYEEMSYKEISEITQLTVGNVGYILHHAMKKMASELAKL